MAAYFHQDWSEEYAGSYEAAVADFVRREPGRVVGARTEIDTLLSRSDSDLAQALEDLGNYYWPGDAADAHRTWLASVRHQLDIAQL